MENPLIQFDSVVIGAGVIGIAVARSLAIAGRTTLLLEAQDSFGSGISSRNSEVIHAGIYYPQGSLKARLCVAGRALLYAYCRERGVEHRRTGKLIVACDAAEVTALAGYRARALANGVADLELLSRAEALALEPALQCEGALLSPSTGIVDSHGLMFALLSDFEHAGGTYVARSPVLGGRAVPGGIELDIGGAEGFTVHAAEVVNAAGLDAQAVARSIAGVAPASVTALHYAIGHYFSLGGTTPFSRLVYPVAGKGGLGVHLTLDLAGRARFGPDISWRDSCDYRFDETRVDSFYSAIRRYFPALADRALAPAYTGIRPKLAAPGEPDADFLVQGAEAHGVQGLLNLYGIESPGLTSCLALAEYVRERLTAAAAVRT